MNTAKINELLTERKYSLLKDELLKGQLVDIAEIIDELDAKTTLLVFRLLPKEIAADVFAYLSSESQSELSMLVNEQELQDILEALYFDDKIDFWKKCLPMWSNAFSGTLGIGKEAYQPVSELFGRLCRQFNDD